MNCRICSRHAVGTYCNLHERARSNIVKKYDVWRMALEISWEEYLSEIMQNDYSGSWVKEVAEQQMNGKEG